MDNGQCIKQKHWRRIAIEWDMSQTFVLNSLIPMKNSPSAASLSRPAQAAAAQLVTGDPEPLIRLRAAVLLIKWSLWNIHNYQTRKIHTVVINWK